MFTGIQKIAVYDPATGTVVQFNQISPEGEFSDGKFSDETSIGQMLYAGDDASFEFMVMEETGLSQIKTWMEDETPVRLVSLGLEQHVLWREDSFVILKKGFDPAVGKRNRHTIRIVKKGVSNNIVVGTNLLQMAYGWVDANTNNIADNYEIVGSMTATSFTAGVQRLQTVGAQTGLKFRQTSTLIFPIVGANLQFSARVDTLTNGSTLRILAELQNFASGSLANESALLSVGLKNFTTPASMYKMRLNVLEGDSSGSLNALLAYPYLGVQFGAHRDLTY